MSTYDDMMGMITSDQLRDWLSESGHSSAANFGYHIPALDFSYSGPLITTPHTTYRQIPPLPPRLRQYATEVSTEHGQFCMCDRCMCSDFERKKDERKRERLFNKQLREQVREVAKEETKKAYSKLLDGAKRKKPSDDSSSAQPKAKKAKKEALATSSSSSSSAEKKATVLLCDICNDKPRNQVLEPCGHFSMCESCVNKLKEKKCPHCRKVILSSRKIFVC